jgi:hypothetical protein
MGAGNRMLQGRNGRNQYGITDEDHHRKAAPIKPVNDRIAEADCRGNEWLAKGRAAEDTGNKTKAEECYRKGNYWLDRSNKLRGER